MFFSADQIRESLEHSEPIHPFFGISFLAFKMAELPVGSETRLPIAKLETEVLDRYYSPAPDYDGYYVPFRARGRKKRWVNKRYPDTTLQRIRADTFKDVLRHKKGTQNWGWEQTYVKGLRSHLGDQLIPAFHLAVWLYRERQWSSETRPEDVIDAFFEEFHITEEEQRALFDVSVPELPGVEQMFEATKVPWRELRSIIGAPPGAPPEEEGTLTFLELRGVGPAKQLCFQPAERLNIITGDNGLGKTFLLECAWWALSGHWAEHPAFPRQDAKAREPSITFQIAGRSAKSQVTTIAYDWATQSWPSPRGRPTIPGLLLYARVDGSFAVWDPAKHYWSPPSHTRGDTALPGLFVFTKDQVWDGLHAELPGGKTRVFCNGLLRDWIIWQNNPERYPFEVFKIVMRRLSPPELGPLEPGEPTRLPHDVREIPTLRHPYGEVPIVYASAGIRRIVTVAYLLVWAWEEHRTSSEMIRKKPQKRMVILVDEMEAHLHPQWQRAIVPALMDVAKLLSTDLQVQLLIGTHSPLVMASVEPVFDPEQDKLFHLDLVKGQVLLEEIRYIRYGPVDAWLRSEVFGLTHARSMEAEKAIEDAKALQLQAEPDPAEIRRVSERLTRYLSDHDEFWPRWKYFAEQHGVHL